MKARFPMRERDPNNISWRTAMSNEQNELRVGDKAPEFLINTTHGKVPVSQLAGRCEKLALTSQDSYRYHPN
jgi:hypothetical protein